MELNRLLLLAAFLMNARLSQMKTVRLLCDKKMIEKYSTDATKMETEMKKICTRVPPMNGSITLPDVGVNKVTWNNKTKMVQGKEIVSHLSMLLDQWSVVMDHNEPNCATELLQKLYKNIKNLCLIVKKLILQDGATLPSLLPTDFRGKNTTSRTDIFTCYKNLIKGKVMRFFVSLKPANCSTSSR